MKLKRSVVGTLATVLAAGPALATVGAVLAASPLLSGCSDLVRQYPTLAPVLGSRPTATPFSLQKGHVRGIVVGKEGKGQPIGLAFVTTGGVSAFTAEPKEDQLVEEDNSNKDKNNITVEHDFDGEDGPKGPELAVRIIRKNPPREDEKYVYLRKGEFFLEGVPVGQANLVASFGNVQSPVNPVTVYENTIVEDVSLDLFIPDPIPAGADGSQPRIVEWAKLEPVNGVSVSIIEKKEVDPNGQSNTTFTITYKPEPPDINVTLRSPPGSRGAVISGYEIFYRYNTPAQQREGKPDTALGPINVPTPPFIVPAAQPISFGAPVVIQIPIGSRTLNRVFEATNKDDIPGLVVCQIEFRDEKDQPILNKNVQPLRVFVPMRAL